MTVAAGALSPSFACAGGGNLPLSRGCYKAKFSVPGGDGWQRVVLPLSSFSDAVARELEAQLATERGRRRNETHRAEEAEGLAVQLSCLAPARGWMDEAAPLSPLMPRPMPSAASPDTEAHRRNFLPRWAPRVGNQELHRELAADEALHRPRQRVAELAEQRRVLQAAEFDGGCWPRQRLFV